MVEKNYQSGCKKIVFEVLVNNYKWFLLKPKERIIYETSFAKNKGKRLQNKVRDLILEKFNQLEPDDVRSVTMGDSGEDILLSPVVNYFLSQ